MSFICDKWEGVMNKFITKLFNFNDIYFNDRDEYQRHKIYQIFANANVLVTFLLTVSIFISYIWHKYQGTSSNLSTVLGMILFFKEMYIASMKKKYGLNKIEYYNQKDYINKIKIIRRRSVYATLATFAIMLVPLHDLNPVIIVTISTIVAIVINIIAYRVDKNNMILVKVGEKDDE